MKLKHLPTVTVMSIVLILLYELVIKPRYNIPQLLDLLSWGIFWIICMLIVDTIVVAKERRNALICDQCGERMRKVLPWLWYCEHCQNQRMSDTDLDQLFRGGGRS